MMVGKVLKKGWKRLGLVFIVYLLFTSVWLGAKKIKNVIVEQRDTETNQMLENVSYTEAEANVEIEKLEAYVGSRNLSDYSLGHTYKALAELYYMTGKDKKYNEQISLASYYLNKAGDDNALADLYMQYIGKLYSNGAYNSCLFLFDELTEKIDITNCNQEIQIAYYLNNADVYVMSGNNEKANENIEAAKQILNSDIVYPEKGVDLAKVDLLYMREYISNQNFGDAQNLFLKYHESDTFGLSRDNMFLICDYTIPYYEMSTKLLLEEKKYAEASECVTTYIEYCDKYNFRRMKLNLLEYVDRISHEDDSFSAEDFNALEKELMTQTLNEFSEQYGEYLLRDVRDQMQDMDDEEFTDIHLRKVIFEIVTVVFCILLISLFMNLVFLELRIDGLTKLRNRKAYEEDREKMYRKKDSYYLMIIDIDDFKKINDTFGHHIGDEVLEGIAEILRKAESGTVRSYRYGGEEMCIVFKTRELEAVTVIAEKIRTNIEKDISRDNMRVTISGGVAFSEDGENAFRKADGLLYQAKAEGKNRILFESN